LDVVVFGFWTSEVGVSHFIHSFNLSVYELYPLHLTTTINCWGVEIDPSCFGIETEDICVRKPNESAASPDPAANPETNAAEINTHSPSPFTSCDASNTPNHHQDYH
jgi:hypothetical protein